MPSDVSVSDEELQKCFEAFARRRLTRGEQSIRTPEGFQRLHTRYQRHITTVSDPATSKDEEAEDSACRRNILNVFFNPKILRIITETCWRLANFGGGTLNDERSCADLELNMEKYETFSLRLVQWVIPELPRRQVQELVQYDWELDRKFDELGMDGLSLQGFQLSLLDLLISCTDGTVAKCLEFLNLMARWLQHSLPPYIIKDSTPQVDEDLATTNDLKQLTKAIAAKIVWKTVPFSVMTPSPISKHGLYCELKTKACSAPIAIMILAATENPMELVLAPSPKTHLQKPESRKNKEGACWTFSMSPKSSSVLLVPGSTVRRQTKALYACFRSPISRVDSCIDGDESDRRERSETQNAASSADLTLFTSVPELIFLKFGSKRYTMERMSSRIFTVERSDKTFTITLTGPFLQSSHSTGEPPVLSTLETNSTFSISDSYPRDDDVRQSDAHTFVFILESPVLRNNGLKHDQAIQPRQWFTSMNSANVTKTIIFNSSECGDKVKETQTKEMYQLFVFTLHGVNIEVACNSGNLERNREESEPEAQETDADNPNKFPEVTSSSLLKELLQLQRTRQQEIASEPLPDMVIGMQVSASKPATTAESLRSKILRSRQDERYARYLPEMQIKILEEKPSRKSPVSRKPRDFNESVETPLSPMSELKKRVNQLTTFFHEMAVHQPRDDELHGSAVEAAEAVAEEQLLKRFSDMFDYDADLQNALDEEKWSTDPVKIARRRDSMCTNLPKMITETRDDSREGNWTFEDYENTAQYIEQLMIDVASHATQQQAQQIVDDRERKRAVMTQLVDSWQYTQHQWYKAATQKRINEMEHKRRTQWLQSEYIQSKRGDKPQRPVLVLPKQRFLVQEHSLPSNAIWEVSKAPNNQSVLRTVTPPTETTLTPHCPPNRPATVSTVERSSNITALRSAAISRARVRRIRSAHSTVRGDSTSRNIQTTSLVSSEQDEASPQQETPDLTSNDDALNHNESSCDSSPHLIDDPVRFEAPSSTSPTDHESGLETKIASVEKSTLKRRKRLKKKRVRTDIHFRRRVLELVSISAQLEALDGEKWKEAQGIESVDELSSMPCLPIK